MLLTTITDKIEKKKQQHFDFETVKNIFRMARDACQDSS